ncbi:alpha/beta hydrolase [Paenibacillus sp. FSL L8-0436]|uniref:alpha/beta fold hydrolase n=1 Tax=Paenibacillus sp. FSL L8-0436 TaxID=2954686 RepID=UPI003158D819
MLKTKLIPPPGKLIRVKGKQMHIRISGLPGGKTVVFDHGCGYGSYSDTWSLVEEKVAPFAQTVVYDRAGYGWSEKGSVPRNNEEAVEDLHELLQAAGVRQPFIYVGHSYGGVNARLYAERYPENLAGIVLVDASHEDELTERFPREHVKGQKSGIWMFRMLYWLTRAGILNWLLQRNKLKDFEALLKHFPEPIAERMRLMTPQRATGLAVYQEFKNLQLGYDAVRNKSLPAGLPLLVLKSGKVEHLEKLPSGIADKITSCLLDVAEEMSQLSDQGELVVVEGSGHNIHIERPDAVAQGIRQML